MDLSLQELSDKKITFASFERPSFPDLAFSLVTNPDGNGELFVEGKLYRIDLCNQLNQISTSPNLAFKCSADSQVFDACDGYG